MVKRRNVKGKRLFSMILERHSQPGFSLAEKQNSKNKAKKPLIAERLFFLMIVWGEGHWILTIHLLTAYEPFLLLPDNKVMP